MTGGDRWHVNLLHHLIPKGHSGVIEAGTSFINSKLYAESQDEQKKLPSAHDSS